MKKKVRCVSVAVGLLALSVFSRDLDRWLAPTNGWAHNYVAAAGSGPGSGVPTQHSSLWINAYYQTNDPAGLSYAGIIPDVAEGDVLSLVHTNGATSVSPYYYMQSGPGAGTTNDLITMDCRFRLADAAQDDAKPQFMLGLARPRLDGSATGWNHWTFLFSEQLLEVGTAQLSVPLGTNWHTVRLVADVARNTSAVYLDNLPVPVYSGPSVARAYTTARNWTAFGDSGQTVNGQVEVKYLRWTTNELVSPLIYYRQEGDADPVSAGFAYKPLDLDYSASNNVLPQSASPGWYSTFKSTQSWLTNDAVTGEAALHLDMVGGGMYTLYREAGQFNTNDLVTADFRFRLVDDSQTESMPQMMLTFVGPRPDGIGGQQFFYCRFAKDRIYYFDDNNTSASVLTALGTAWHNLQWRMNWNTREGDVYLDGNPVKMFSHRSRLYTTQTNNFTSFGDGSGAIQGITRVAHLRVTRHAPAWQGGAEADGTPYWQGADGDGSYGYYEGGLSADMISDAQGWTASCRLRLTQQSPDNFGVMMRCFDHANAWDLMFTRDAWHYRDADGNAALVGASSRPEEYHTFQMRYDPAGDNGNGAVSYYKNGWLLQTLTRADTYTNGSSTNLFQWGCDNVPSATSTQRWNFVEFAPGNRVIAPIPRDGTLISVR